MLPAAENTRPSSSLTRRARRASRSRRSITASSWASGPIGREAITFRPGWAARIWRQQGRHLALRREGVGQQQRDEDDLFDPALGQLVDHVQGVRLVADEGQLHVELGTDGEQLFADLLADLGDPRDRRGRS